VKFASAAQPVKVGGAKIVNPKDTATSGTAFLDVQVGGTPAEPVFVRLAGQQGDLSKLLREKQLTKMIRAAGGGIEVQDCAKPLECCETDDKGQCVRECCPHD
jgi:hypothetical protein